MEFIEINGILEVKTGLHIGGIKETVKIGGQDAPVIKIRSGKSEVPYIPGSSLKGKLRSLLEEKYPNNDQIISKMFGGNERGKVIFRDAHLYGFKPNSAFVKEEVLEIKPENKINRETGKAEHPRFIERVVPGTKFYVEIIVISDDDKGKNEILKKLKEGFELLQKNYLGLSLIHI